MHVVAVGISPGRSRSPGVPFAGGDARRFGEIPDSSGEILCDERATGAALREAIGRLARESTDETVGLVALILPATVDDGRLLLELADGPADPRELLDSAWHSDRKRLVLALDLARGRDRCDEEWAAALQALVRGWEPRVGRTLLVSDDGGGASHVSGELHAGIWAYHLAAAFAGDEPRAREADGRLTAGSLRAYLAEEIEVSLRRAFSEAREQLPLVLAVSDEEVLAEPAAVALASGNERIELCGAESIPVKQLGGFRKSIHTAPADTLESSREWVLRLAETDLRRELEETVSRLRETMGYTRRQLRASGPAHGGASILTPDFAVHFVVEQSAEKPQIATVSRSLSEIRDLEILRNEALARAMPKGFTELRQPFERRADVPSLIDLLEESRFPAISRIDYPSDARYCDLTLAGLGPRVRIEAEGLTVFSDSPLGPGELVMCYAGVREALK